MKQTKICNISLPQVVDFYQHNEAFAIFLVLILTTSSMVSQEKCASLLMEKPQLKIIYFIYPWSNKCLKGTVVNRTWYSVDEELLEITNFIILI